jgi:hypothetical protein
MAAVLRAPNQLCYFVWFFALFVTYFVHNIAATVSYDWKDLLEIRTAITHPELDEDAKDILLLWDQAQIPSFAWRKDGNTGGGDWGAWREFVGEWVTRLYHPFYWPTCNHWKIYWMISVRDYLTNVTLKTVISYVSPSCV